MYVNDCHLEGNLSTNLLEFPINVSTQSKFGSMSPKCTLHYGLMFMMAMYTNYHGAIDSTIENKSIQM